MDEGRKCSYCGAVLDDEARFCHLCGERYVEEAPVQAKFCRGCGEELVPEALFCSKCGFPVSKPIENNATKSKSINKGYVKGIITKSIVTLVALLAFVFAFLPVITVKTKIYDIKVDFNVSVIDGIVFSFDAMQSLDDEELEDTRLYEKISDLSDELDKNDSDADDDEIERIVRKLLPLSIRLMLKSDAAPYAPSYTLNIFIGIIYLLVTVALLAFSVLDLVFFILKKENIKYSASALRLLTSIPALSLVVYIAMRFSFFSSTMDIGFAQLSSGIGSGVLLNLIFTLALTIWLAVERIFIVEKPKVSAGIIVKRSLSLAVAVLLLFSVFIPVISFKVKTQFENSDEEKFAVTKLDSDIFNEFALTDDMIEAFEKYEGSEADESLMWYYNSLSSYTKRQFETGKANIVNTTILFYAFNGYGGAKISWLIALIPMLMIFTSLMAAVIVWLNLYSITTGKSMHASVSICAKIFAVLFTVLALAIVIVFITIASYNLENALEAAELAKSRIGVKIAAGSIVALVSSVIMASVPVRIKKKKAHIETID